MGHDVTGLDSDLYRRSTFGGHQLEPVPSLTKDVRDVVAADLKGYEAIVHLAGLSNDPLGSFDPSLTFEINCAAAVETARLAKSVGVSRFVFASSCSIYGAAGGELIDETASMNPVTPYGRSKLMAEEELADLADEKFSPVYVRSATAYGMSPKIRFDLVINNLAAWASTTGEVHLKSDGAAWRPCVHVEDLSRAYAAILAAPREVVHNEAFNIGATGENFRVRELAEIVRDAVPGSRVTFADGAQADGRCYRVSCDKIGRLLPDYRARWDVRSGAEQLYRGLSKAGLRVDEFEGSRYNRLPHLKELIRVGLLDTNLRVLRSPAARYEEVRDARAS